MCLVKTIAYYSKICNDFLLLNSLTKRIKCYGISFNFETFFFFSQLSVCLNKLHVFFIKTEIKAHASFPVVVANAKLSEFPHRRIRQYLNGKIIQKELNTRCRIGRDAEGVKSGGGKEHCSCLLQTNYLRLA